jgi:hypothetical protein
MPSVPIRRSLDGRNVGYAVERADAPGFFYDFTAVAFVAGPLAAAQVKALVESADPAFAGRGEDVWNPSSIVAPPGDYIVTFHDLDSSTLQYLDQIDLTIAGSGAGGALTAEDVRDVIFARLIDETPFAGVVSLLAAFASGKMRVIGNPAIDRVVTIIFRSLDDSADRIVAVADSTNPAAAVRNVTLTPGT